MSQDDVTSQWSEEAEQVRKSFSLSPADDVTVECVAFNHMAMSRQIFKSGMFSGTKGFRFPKRFPVSNSGLHFSSGGPETLFTPSLIGAVSTAGVLLLLLLVALYKWKQVYFCCRLQGSHTLRDPLLFSYCVIFLRNQNTRSAGRSLKALTETTTPLLTLPSYHTTTNGSFPETSYALVHCACNREPPKC